MDAGTMIRDARRASGLTQAELARLSATSQTTLSAYERSSKSPSSATLVRILQAAGARLSLVTASRRVRTQRAADLALAGRGLAEVLELSALLPSRHQATLAYPRLPRPEVPREPG